MTQARITTVSAGLLAAILALLILSGCFTGEVITNLREGMTREQVEQTLGKPDGFQRYGNSVALKYTNKIISGWSWDRADYYAILVDDKLMEWGSGQVRQNSANNSLVLFTVQCDSEICPGTWRAAQLGRTSTRFDPQAEQRNPPHVSGNGVSGP